MTRTLNIKMNKRCKMFCFGILILAFSSLVLFRFDKIYQIKEENGRLRMLVKQLQTRLRNETKMSVENEDNNICR